MLVNGILWIGQTKVSNDSVLSEWQWRMPKYDWEYKKKTVCRKHNNICRLPIHSHVAEVSLANEINRLKTGKAERTLRLLLLLLLLLLYQCVLYHCFWMSKILLLLFIVAVAAASAAYGDGTVAIDTATRADDSDGWWWWRLDKGCVLLSLWHHFKA